VKKIDKMAYEEMLNYWMMHPDTTQAELSVMFNISTSSIHTAQTNYLKKLRNNTKK